jgi:hypothetical protein
VNALLACLGFVALFGLYGATLLYHHDSEITTRVCVAHSSHPEMCTVESIIDKDGTRIK